MRVGATGAEEICTPVRVEVAVTEDPPLESKLTVSALASHLA